MGLVIIFALVTLLAGYSSFTALKNKNFLGLFFAAATFLVFGWFTFMTVWKDGYPI
ncbi:DUF2759 domain-containing protein [Neobacillus notoginsengisoli]|uniref:DUF2759 domain-containing protein n=1 Tax=Neobacillus notoginsengisoli TaxID=1578198 RepID=A0A417YUY0_9BACI|nr:DUF2759 domain-containing protein [Neobacillus notoginsengisoli]RHW41069.1 DUF2759 domain-containing protein [Neobacillus notoginsengisoli]